MDDLQELFLKRSQAIDALERGKRSLASAIGSNDRAHWERVVEARQRQLDTIEAGIAELAERDGGHV